MWTLLFDIDGTLLKSGGAGMESMYEAVKTEFGLDSTVEVDFHGRPDRSIADEILKAHDLDRCEENYERVMQAYYRNLPSLLDKMDGQVLPGVQSMIEQLHERNDVALGLLTGNSRFGADVKLRHYKLDQYFSFGGFGGEHFHRDQIAEQAVNEASDTIGDQFSIDRCWVIGDTPRDITCTRHIGAAVLSVCTGGYRAEQLREYSPDVLLEDLSDVEQVIETLTSPPPVAV